MDLWMESALRADRFPPVIVAVGCVILVVLLIGSGGDRGFGPGLSCGCDGARPLMRMRGREDPPSSSSPPL